MRRKKQPRGNLARLRALYHRKGWRNPEYSLWDSGTKVYVYVTHDDVTAFTARPKKEGCVAVSYIAAMEYRADDGGNPWD